MTSTPSYVCRGLLAVDPTFTLSGFETSMSTPFELNVQAAAAGGTTTPYGTGTLSVTCGASTSATSTTTTSTTTTAPTCIAGQFVNTATNLCEACAVDTYSAGGSATSCTACPAGQTTNGLTGQSTCVLTTTTTTTSSTVTTQSTLATNITTEAASSSSEASTLDDGAVAGIVVGSVVGCTLLVALAVVAALYWCKKDEPKSQNSAPDASKAPAADEGVRLEVVTGDAAQQPASAAPAAPTKPAVNPLDKDLNFDFFTDDGAVSVDIDDAGAASAKLANSNLDTDGFDQQSMTSTMGGTVQTTSEAAAATATDSKKTSSDVSAAARRKHLNQQLKKFRETFLARSGREPTIADIEADPAASAIYHEFSQARGVGAGELDRPDDDGARPSLIAKPATLAPPL
jgi:hypothetical protein